MSVRISLGNFLFIYFDIILAGTPTAVAPSGISEITTAPAPIFTLFPILTSPIIVALAPI